MKKKKKRVGSGHSPPIMNKGGPHKDVRKDTKTRRRQDKKEAQE